MRLLYCLGGLDFVSGWFLLFILDRVVVGVGVCCWFAGE